MARILYAADSSGRPTKTANVDLPSLRYSRERAYINRDDMYKLIKLFGDGYMVHRFHLIVTDDEVMLHSCQMIETGGLGDGARLTHDGIVTDYPHE